MRDIKLYIVDLDVANVELVFQVKTKKNRVFRGRIFDIFQFSKYRRRYRFRFSEISRYQLFFSVIAQHCN